MQNNSNYPKNVLNKIYTAEIKHNSFKNDDTGQEIKFAVLELGLKVNGEIIKLALNLSKKSNAEILILASEEQKENWLDEENAM
ncbi:MAG: hypothetical protein Q4A27_00385 [bacterium]|nr:hypothetical protein [bacterium]